MSTVAAAAVAMLVVLDLVLDLVLNRVHAVTHDRSLRDSLNDECQRRIVRKRMTVPPSPRRASSITLAGWALR